MKTKKRSIGYYGIYVGLFVLTLSFYAGTMGLHFKDMELIVIAMIGLMFSSFIIVGGKIILDKEVYFKK